jgi:hypothetical protein
MSSGAPNPAGAPQIPPPTPTVQLSTDDGLSKSLPLRLKFAKTHPNYANSFGTVAFESYSFGRLPKLIGWRVIGLVQQLWRDLEPSLIDLVQAKRQHLELRRPKDSPKNPIWMLRCFLLGPDQEHATPHVVVLGTKWLRQGIGQVINRSGLLRACEFRCCGLPYKVELDMAPGPRNASSAVVASSPAWSPGRLGDFQVRHSSSKGVNGLEIEILLDDTVVSKATIGGVIGLGGHRLGMTVLHAFQAPDAEEAQGEDLELEGFSVEYYDEEDDMAVEQSAASPGGQVDPARPHNTPQVLALSTPEASQLSSAVQEFLNRPQSDSHVWCTPNAQFDWALKKLHPSAQNKRFVTPWAGLPQDQIWIKTATELKLGTLESSGVFGVPTSGLPQPVMVAAMPSAMRLGDSGAWAMTVDYGIFVGMLLGSCPSLNEVYLLRMGDIMGDIRQQMGLEPTISLRPSDPTGPTKVPTSFPELRDRSAPWSLLGSQSESDDQSAGHTPSS